jgi:UDP-N-acetylglucosamine 2-epimerase (non-hydrolysing)
MSRGTIAYVVGARPNFVKMAPVLAALRRRAPDVAHVLVHTGQHFDAQMSDIFFAELGMPMPDHVLDVGPGTHAVQTARVLMRLEEVLVRVRPDLLLVPGDVNSTLGAALVAAKLQIPLGHVESGLRSFDRSMPEEINRIVADQLSDHLFTHSQEANDNLEREGKGVEQIHLVGNTMIDTLVALEHLFRGRDVAASLQVRPGDYLLVTLHRPALVDGPLLEQVLRRLEEVAKTLPVVFPVHPRTRKQLGRRSSVPGLSLVEPLGYLDFLSLEADAAAVLTDSGGIQEETTYLGVPCFTLRDTTERPVTTRIGTNVLLGLDPDRIPDIVTALGDDSRVRPAAPPPLWDGRAADRIADVLVGSGRLETGVTANRSSL